MPACRAALAPSPPLPPPADGRLRYPPALGVVLAVGLGVGGVETLPGVDGDGDGDGVPEGLDPFGCGPLGVGVGVRLRVGLAVVGRGVGDTAGTVDWVAFGAGSCIAAAWVRGRT
jgi:hypothetical protein